MQNAENFHGEEPKREIIQLDPSSGLSHDYLNEYNALIMSINFYLDGNEDFLKSVLKMIDRDSSGKGGRLILDYEERFNPKEFENGVNEKNFSGTQKLNSIARICNKEFVSAYKNEGLPLKERLKNLRDVLTKRREEAYAVITKTDQEEGLAAA